MSENFIESSMPQSATSVMPRQLASTEDLAFEIPLRPQSLSEFVGQDSLRERLEVLVGAAKHR